MSDTDHKDLIMGVDVFSRTIAVGGKTVGNRFVVLPTEGNDAAPDGAPSSRTVRRYRKHAQGGAGMIYTEAVAIAPGARARVNQLTLTDKGIEGFRTLAREVHAANPDVLFMMQLDHAGSLADPRFASPLSVYARPGAARILSDGEIASIRDNFIRSIVTAADVGFDGAELKFAHGFLCNEFIQPANTRPGMYGGGFENRTRFFAEIMEGAKAALAGRDFILGVRFSAYEGLAGGFGSESPEGVIENIDEPLRFVRLAQKLGCGVISVSAGSAAGNLEILLPSKSYAEGCYRHFGWAQAVKRAVSVPVIGAGYSHLRDGHNGLAGAGPDPLRKSMLYWAERNIELGAVDLVGLGRQAIADADFPKKVLSGKTDEIDWCTTCAGCGILLGEQKHVGCSLYDGYYKELFEARKA